MGEREKPYFPEWEGEVVEQSLDEIPERLFAGGTVLISKEASLALGLAGEDYRALLGRHLVGDWGDCLRKDEKMLNDLAVEHGEDVLSAYMLANGVEIWITTDRDRENTFIELPQEAKARAEEK
jgi:hypothetical protein